MRTVSASLENISGFLKGWSMCIEHDTPSPQNTPDMGWIRARAVYDDQNCSINSTMKRASMVEAIHTWWSVRSNCRAESAGLVKTFLI